MMFLEYVLFVSVDKKGYTSGNHYFEENVEVFFLFVMLSWYLDLPEGVTYIHATDALSPEG
jgi:hypothetical protein